MERVEQVLRFDSNSEEPMRLGDKRPGDEHNVPGLFVSGDYSNEVQQLLLEGKGG